MAGLRIRYALYAAAVAGAALFLGSCRKENIPPAIGDRLSAPTGLLVATIGGRPVLFVTNANFSLEYDSGSVVAIDLAAVDTTQRFNLVDGVVRSALPLPNFSGPIALSPDGTTLLITNRFTTGEQRTGNDRLFFVDASNPDALRLAPLAPGHADTNGAITLGQDPYGIATVRFPSAGPGVPARDLAFVANQSDSSLSLVNISAGSSCDDGTPAPCEQDGVPVPRGSKAVFADVGTGANINFTGPGIAAFETPTEAWEVTFVEANGLCPVPADGSAAGYWRVVGSLSGQFNTHACTGVEYAQIGLSFEIDRVLDSAGNITGHGPSSGDTFTFDTFAGDFEPVSRIPMSAALKEGTISGRGIGQLLFDPFRNRIYASSRATDFIYVLSADDYRIQGVWQIVTSASGIDSRGLALSPDGSELYVINRSPEALIIINPDDMSDELEPHIVHDGVIASIPVSNGPGELAISPDGRYAFVAANIASVVDVIDLQNRMQVRSIPVGHAPYTVRLSEDGRLAYVATYFGPGIDVLDVDPTSASFGTVLTTISNSTYVPEF